MYTPWGFEDFDAHEDLHFISDEKCGLKAIIAVHSTHLGPAAGGCRFWHYADPADALRYATYDVDLSAHWPGALTIVGARTAESSEWDLGGDGATIGLRCPDDDDLRALIREVGPLVTTSANKHGQPPCTTAAEVTAQLGDIAVLDGGTRNGQPSTVVDATQNPPRVLRQGAIVIA